MPEAVSLDAISFGEVGAEQAQDFLAPMFACGDVEVIHKACSALRAWTWKALRERRSDGELRSWYNLMRGYAAHLEKDNPEYSIRLSVLYELVYESIAVGEVVTSEELLKRDRPSAILKLLVGAEGCRLGRSRLAALLDISETDLTRAVSLLAITGLVHREGFGAEVAYTASLEGVAAIRRKS